jgi:glycosyltransferase involved in cell wall biosynthesis
MRIMIDGLNLNLREGTGIATYARNLAGNLKTLGHEVHVLYGLPGSADRSAMMREISFYDDVSPTGRVARILGPFREAFGLISCVSRPLSAYKIPTSGMVINRPFAARMPKFDHLWNVPNLFTRTHRAFYYFRFIPSVRLDLPIEIMHWTYPLPIRVQGAKNIYTIHDLVPLRLPYTTLDNKMFYLRLMKATARGADHIVTVSENSRRDIVEWLGVPENKVTNTYEAVDIPSLFLNVPIEKLERELAGSFGVKYKNYVLFYGAIEPKKNVGRIIEAYLASNIDKPLVLAGASAWKSDHELRLLTGMRGEAIQRMGRIIRLPYVPFAQLINLIRGALTMVFPSLYEGFGLPILESMLCGTPVITSNFGSMKEISGNAALLVDPYNTEEIKEAIIGMVSSSALQSEKSMLGYKVAACYSNEAYRKRLKDVYDTVRASKR